MNNSAYGLCRWWSIALLLMLGTATAIAKTPEYPSEIRLGFQKYAISLFWLKANGTLEKLLEPKGVKVTWGEFVAGPQMLEALNAGRLDWATTGETPPVFAQAAKGSPLVYVAYEPAAPGGEAILVRNDSPLHSVADLKGKKVALNKGSNVHYLLLRALEQAGLSIKDIKATYLAPGDARPAFERGNVDAWVIWDPFFAAAEQQLGARVLADGTDLVDNYQFYLSTHTFAQKYPELLGLIVGELRKADEWVRGHVDEAAEFLAPQVGIAPAVLSATFRRANFGTQGITPEVVTGQQRIADAFHHVGLLPKPLRVTDAVIPLRLTVSSGH